MYVYMYVCIYAYVWVHIYHSIHVEDRDQVLGVISLPPPCDLILRLGAKYLYLLIHSTGPRKQTFNVPLHLSTIL